MIVGDASDDGPAPAVFVGERREYVRLAIDDGGVRSAGEGLFLESLADGRVHAGDGDTRGVGCVPRAGVEVDDA